MTYLEKLMSAVKVDDELLTPQEAKQLRRALSEFFTRNFRHNWCRMDFSDGASQSPKRCLFRYDCFWCWNQEAE